MTRLPLSLLVAAAVALATASCTPNDKTTTTDSTTGSAAAAADTAGAHVGLAKDNAGVKMDSASTKTMDHTGGPGATGPGTSTPAEGGAGTTK